MTKLGTLVAAALLTATVAGCANAPTNGADDGGGDGIAHPTGADQLVLRVETGGGFVPVEYLYTQIPGFSLYGDGRAIVTGAQIEIYPPPALPPLIETRLTEEGVQQVLRAALDAGLDRDRDLTSFGQTYIADAPTTTFTLTVDGVTHTTAVYALGELGERPPGMPSEEYEARRALLDLWTRVGDLRPWLPEGSVGEDRPFEPAGLRLFVSPYRGEDELPQPAIDWPLATALADLGAPVDDPVVRKMRCGTVEGDDVAALLPAAERANQLTPWVSGGKEYRILFRPLLPDESGCGPA